MFSKGFNAVSYVVMVSLTLISSWIMVSISIRKPVKIAAGTVSYTHLDVYKRQPYIKTVYGMGYQWTGGEAK